MSKSNKVLVTLDILRDVLNFIDEGYNAKLYNDRIGDIAYYTGDVSSIMFFGEFNGDVFATYYIILFHEGDAYLTLDKDNDVKIIDVVCTMFNEAQREMVFSRKM